MNHDELKLPKHIIDKAIRSNNEFGWRKSDVLEVIEAARENNLANLGGQVQYIVPNGTCELYWLSYDTKDRKPNESWVTYCNRTADECIGDLQRIFEQDIEKQARAWDILKDIPDLENHQVFILYLVSQESL